MNATADERRQSRAGWWLFYFVVAAAALFVAYWFAFPHDPQRVEAVYARGIYRVFGNLLTPITSRLPFSLALYLLILLLIGFPLAWARQWVYMRRVLRRSHGAGFLWGIKWAAIIAVIITAWFVVLWGAGYQRPPVAARLELDTSAVRDDEADALRAAALAIIERDQPKLQADRDVARAVSAISVAMERIVAEWDSTPVTVPRRVKATPRGLLLFQGTSGVCSPYTLEPHVDGALPDTAFVYVAAHELGHVAGFCQEDAATLIGFVAGLQADDAFARYAVALDVYLDLIRSLPREEHKAAFMRLPEVARKDYEAVRAAARAYVMPKIERVGNVVYNQYLKSQGVKEGRRSYAQGVTLFVFAVRKGLVHVDGFRALPAAAKPPEAPDPPEDGPVTSAPA